MRAFAFGIEIGKHIKDNESIINLIEKGMKAEEHKPVENQRIDLNSLLPADEPFRSIATSVSGGDVENTVRLVKKSVADGISGLTIATNGLLKGMDAVSTLYNNKQAYVPEILLAAQALDAGLKECGNLEALKSKGTIIVHTADGDLHDIGKNIVAAIVAANGYRIIDLGTSVDSGQVVEAIREHKPIAVLGSSLMTSTRGAFIETADKLTKEGLNVSFIIGGGACDGAFAGQRRNIGYAKDPGSLVRILDAIALINGK